MAAVSKSWDIAILYGSDPYTMTRRLLEGINAAALIPTGASVLLKPNLVLPSPAEEGATTHPQIAAAVIDYLREQGVRDICVAEGSWLGADTAEAAAICGFATLCEHKQVPFFDLRRDAYAQRTVAGVPIEISRRLLESDFLINLPVLKGHCQTKMTCALKNAKGALSDRSKREFHALGLHKPIAALATLLPPQLVVVDGLCGDLDFEEGGNPVFAGRIFAGTDPVLVDSYGAALLGYTAAEVPYIGIAEQLGVGQSDLAALRLLPLGDALPTTMPQATRRVRELGRHLVADGACSACHAAAIYALARVQEAGLLGRLGEKLYLGQGFRGRSLDHAGIGNCCRRFSCSVPGCPPAATDILQFLTGELSR